MPEEPCRKVPRNATARLEETHESFPVLLPSTPNTDRCYTAMGNILRGILFHADRVPTIEVLAYV